MDAPRVDSPDVAAGGPAAISSSSSSREQQQQEHHHQHYRSEQLDHPLYDRLCRIVTIDLHSDDVEILKRGLRELCFLTSQNPRLDANHIRLHRHALLEVGGPSAILGVLKKHTDHGVQTAGIQALMSQCFYFPPASRVAGRMGAVEWLIECLMTSEDARGRLCCGTLCNLLYKSKPNADRMLRANGVEAMIAAMSRHGDDVVLQRHACYAFLNMISYGDVYKQRVRQAGGLGAVSNAIEAHTGSELQTPALKLIHLLSRE